MTGNGSRRAAPVTAEARARPKVVVFGIAFGFPLAGVAWQFVHYMVGLRRLGWDPWYVEDSTRWKVYDPIADETTGDVSRNVAAVSRVFDEHGFAGRWAFRRGPPSGFCYGIGESELLRLYREAAALLNVTGSQEIREEHLVCPRRIYVETDPVASQVKVAQGDAKSIAEIGAHDMQFTYGENLGAPDCGVPVERFRWLPTRQPVVLDFWDGADEGPADSYTTIGTWRHTGKDVVWKGETYAWTKDREFAKFIDLPRRRPVQFAIASRVYDEAARASLAENGWTVRDPVPVSMDTASYRSFIRGSRAEFTVAKDQNIRLRSGWFSDRSACYLAAGRPVITQDTAFGAHLPTGRGLFSFKTMDDALAAIDAIESDYEGNRRAAREIAAEHFAAEKVLGRLMARAGLSL